MIWKQQRVNNEQEQLNECIEKSTQFFISCIRINELYEQKPVFAE